MAIDANHRSGKNRNAKALPRVPWDLRPWSAPQAGDNSNQSVFRGLPQAKRGQPGIAKTAKDYRQSWTYSKPPDFSD
jgi:hypothetical protein